MRRRSKNALVLAVTAMSMFTVTACSGATPLSIEEFTARANEECASLRSASNAFRKAQDPSFTGEQVTRFVGQVSDRLRALVTHLDELEPPDVMKSDVDELLDVLEQYADGLDELGEKTKPNQTFQGVLEESTAEVNRLNDLASDATALVANLGLVECILPS